MSDKNIYTTTHDFKTHFSEYVRLLKEEPDAAIIVQRYKKTIGIFVVSPDSETNNESDKK